MARPRRRAVIAASLLFLAGSTTLQNAAANGDTRTLSFHNVHTGEDLTVTFKRNGRYDEAALAKLNWFMRDWRKGEETKMSPQLFDILWQAYRDVGASEPVHVICGFRSSGTNEMLRNRSSSSGVAQSSLHTQGEAMDFFIPGVPLEKIREAGLRLQRGGVGFYPSSGSPFVHMDTGNIRHWPRMTREQLVRVFPDQRTVHVPSDGEPLAGYALALADVERQGKEPNAVSLAAARDAGVIDDVERTASVKPRKSLLAALFGGNDVNEDNVAPLAAKPAAAKPAKPVVRESIAVAQLSANAATVPTERITRNETVPVPKGRPAVVAALTPTPAPRPQLALAANPVEQRGLWPLEVASADPVVTAALAYAGTAVPPAPATVKPMGTLPPMVDRGHGTKTDSLPRPSLTTASYQGPWLRAMIVTPSVTLSMNTTRLGTLSPEPLVEFMRKPAAALTMAFADDPQNGLRTDAFSGNAVVFLTTASFGTMRTAALAQ